MNTTTVTCQLNDLPAKQTSFMHCHTHEQVWVHKHGDPMPEACPVGTDDCKIHFGYVAAWDRG